MTRASIKYVTLVVWDVRVIDRIATWGYRSVSSRSVHTDYNKTKHTKVSYIPLSLFPAKDNSINQYIKIPMVRYVLWINFFYWYAMRILDLVIIKQHSNKKGMFWYFLDTEIQKNTVQFHYCYTPTCFDNERENVLLLKQHISHISLFFLCLRTLFSLVLYTWNRTRIQMIMLQWFLRYIFSINYTYLYYTYDMQINATCKKKPWMLFELRCKGIILETNVI